MDFLAFGHSTIFLGPILDTCSIQVQALYFPWHSILLPFACYIIDHLKQGIQQSVKIIKMFVLLPFSCCCGKHYFLLSRRSFPRFAGLWSGEIYIYMQKQLLSTIIWIEELKASCMLHLGQPYWQNVWTGLILQGRSQEETTTEANARSVVRNQPYEIF